MGKGNAIQINATIIQNNIGEGFMRFSIILLLLIGITACVAPQKEKVEHLVAAIEKDRFHGWPANNGVWIWGNEILVGYTQGDYDSREGHNITGIEESKFSRSLDGGQTWQMVDPENFLDDDNVKWLPTGKEDLEEPMNFEDPGFAIRFFGTGYHGNDDPEGGFYYSYDRGANWQGPYHLGGLNADPQIEGMSVSARTDYIVLGESELIFFSSLHDGNTNRLAAIQTKDGGMSFELLSWITPQDDDANDIMSSTVRLSDNKFVLAYRKIYPALKNAEGNKIETYVSNDRCKTWHYQSEVKLFESSSNPPALLALQDGSLICVYGDRHHSRMAGKYSMDQGQNWGEEFIFRADFKDTNSNWDFGYPVLVQRTDKKLLCLYYWATNENPQQFIAATLWPPHQEEVLFAKESPVK